MKQSFQMYLSCGVLLSRFEHQRLSIQNQINLWRVFPSSYVHLGCIPGRINTEERVDARPPLHWCSTSRSVRATPTEGWVECVKPSQANHVSRSTTTAAPRFGHANRSRHSTGSSPTITTTSFQHHTIVLVVSDSSISLCRRHRLLTRDRLQLQPTVLYSRPHQHGPISSTLRPLRPLPTLPSHIYLFFLTGSFSSLAKPQRQRTRSRTQKSGWRSSAIEWPRVARSNDVRSAATGGSWRKALGGEWEEGAREVGGEWVRTTAEGSEHSTSSKSPRARGALCGEQVGVLGPVSKLASSGQWCHVWAQLLEAASAADGASAGDSCVSATCAAVCVERVP